MSDNYFARLYLPRYGVICALLLVCGHIQAAHAEALRFQLPDGKLLELPPEQDRAHRAGASQPVTANDSLRKQLLKAGETFILSKQIFMFEGHPAFAAVIRVPSAPNHPMAYCGAGHEDYILLVSIAENIARLRDQILIQSCLKHISLVSDLGDEPRVAVLPADYPEIARVRIISPSGTRIEDKTVTVENGKLAVIAR